MLLVIYCKPHTASLAKHIGGSIWPSSNWEMERVGIMKQILDKKFNQDKMFREMLVSTEEILIHNVPDEFWGTGNDGSGNNVFGSLLMQLRLQRKKECLSNFTKEQEKDSPITLSNDRVATKQPNFWLIGTSIIKDLKPKLIYNDGAKVTTLRDKLFVVQWISWISLKLVFQKT